MSDNEYIADHLKAALLATNADKPFLAYLIQMALIETSSEPSDLQFRNSNDQLDEATPHYEGTSEFLQGLLPSQNGDRMRTNFL